MEKKYYPLVIIIIFMFFSFVLYTYCFFIELGNGDSNFSINDDETSIIFKKIKNIYYDINDSLNKQYAVKMTDYNKEISIFNDNGNFINLNDFSDKVNVSEIVKFNKILKNKNRDFLFILLPEKSYFSLNKLNEYSYNYNFYKKKKILSELKNNSIDYIDSYNILNNMDIEPRKNV